MYRPGLLLHSCWITCLHMSVYVTELTVLCCPVMSCPVLSCPVMSCPVMSCPVMSCPVMSCPVLSCHVLSCHVLSCHVLSCPVSAPTKPKRHQKVISNHAIVRRSHTYTCACAIISNPWFQSQTQISTCLMKHAPPFQINAWNIQAHVWKYVWIYKRICACVSICIVSWQSLLYIHTYIYIYIYILNKRGKT